RALGAARHLPRHLWPGPRLGHACRTVIDPPRRDLARGIPVDADVPATALRPERTALRLRLVARADAAAAGRVPRQPVGDLVVGEEEPLRALFREPRGL